MCEKNLTEKTLADVQAGIPARDAEIEALRKENIWLREQLEAIGAGGVNGKLMPGAVSAEPVGHVSRDASIARMTTNLPEGSPLYAAPVADQVQPKKKAIERYNESGCAEEEPSPLERLRFFCSLAMSGDDWVDAGPLFDSVSATQQPVSGAGGARGEVVVTWDVTKKKILAVTRQDDDGQVLSVIAMAWPDHFPDATKMVPGDQFRDAAQMTAQQPATTVVKESLTVDEREVFEWWASDDGEFPKAVERSGHGYKLTQTQTYWMAWQARAALAQQDAHKGGKI